MVDRLLTYYVRGTYMPWAQYLLLRSSVGFSVAVENALHKIILELCEVLSLVTGKTFESAELEIYVLNLK